MERVEPRTASREDESADVDFRAIDLAWVNGTALTDELERIVSQVPNRHAFFTGLLSKLEDPHFGRDLAGGRTLRSAYVEAVLLGGYPWALQLEPTDLSGLPRPRRFEPPRALVAGLIAFLVGLGVALALVPAKVAPAPPPPMELPAPVVPVERFSQVKPAGTRVGPSLEPLRGGVTSHSLHDVTEAIKTTAETMRTLIATGHADRAIVLGEACVLSFQATRECMVMLASAHEHTRPPDRVLARRWYALSQRQDVLVRTREARALASTSLASDWATIETDLGSDPLASLQRLGKLALAPCPMGTNCDALSRYFVR